jgi:hypothetical protein
MTEENTINFNQNQIDCQKSQSYWGTTTYVNVCTGKTYNVQWGSMDYVGVGFALAIGLVILVFLGSMVRMFWDN